MDFYIIVVLLKKWTAITDSDGASSISVKPGKHPVKINSMGYKAQEIEPVTESDTRKKFTLVTDLRDLNET